MKYFLAIPTEVQISERKKFNDAMEIWKVLSATQNQIYERYKIKCRDRDKKLLELKEKKEKYSDIVDLAWSAIEAGPWGSVEEFEAEGEAAAVGLAIAKLQHYDWYILDQTMKIAHCGSSYTN